jgi:hypothetical protein
LSKDPPRKVIWTPEMDAYVRREMKHSSYEQIGLYLGVSKNSVCGRVKRLGLCRFTVVRGSRMHASEAAKARAPITLPRIRIRYDLDPDT